MRGKKAPRRRRGSETSDAHKRQFLSVRLLLIAHARAIERDGTSGKKEKKEDDGGFDPDISVKKHFSFLFLLDFLIRIFKFVMRPRRRSGR